MAKKWTTKRVPGAGAADRSANEITIPLDQSPEKAAVAIYHEVHHLNQPASMDWEDAEVEAYYETEKWAIERGLPTQGKGFRVKGASGNLVPDRKAMRDAIRKNYPLPPSAVGGKKPPRPIAADTSGNRTKVRDRTTGKTYWRPSKAGDTFPAPQTRVNERVVDPKEWKYP